MVQLVNVHITPFTICLCSICVAFSNRYICNKKQTGKNILKPADGRLDMEKSFYHVKGNQTEYNRIMKYNSSMDWILFLHDKNDFLTFSNQTAFFMQM